MVTIVIVSYNTKEFIFLCIQSIEKYAPKGTEVIVVDNNSQDESVKVLRDLRFKNYDLKIIENKENLGYSKAVNQGIRASGGEYIFVLNPDTRITKGSIQELLKFAEKDKDVGIVAPKLLNPSGSVQPSCYHEPNLSSAFKEYFLGIKGAFQKYAPRGEEPVIVDAVVGAAMFVPRVVIDKVGMFDERYFMYFEDLDYCRRVRNAGFAICYLPSAKVYHEHGGITRTVPEKAKQWLIKSSKVYHGEIEHHLLTLILLLGQKWQKLF